MSMVQCSYPERREIFQFLHQVRDGDGARLPVRYRRPRTARRGNFPPPLGEISRVIHYTLPLTDTAIAHEIWSWGELSAKY